MLFYNDECDLVDDDRYDLFTLTTQIQRHTSVFQPCPDPGARGSGLPTCGRARARSRQHWPQHKLLGISL